MSLISSIILGKVKFKNISFSKVCDFVNIWLFWDFHVIKNLKETYFVSIQERNYHLNFAFEDGTFHYIM